MIANLCEIRVGDVLDQLRRMPSKSVDIVITSPPYWGVRDYGMPGQIGLEPTLDQHIQILVEIFREVRRILKPHGSLWLNYGDCYASEPNGNRDRSLDNRSFTDKPMSTIGGPRKAKDLCLIPERLVIALQEDGWWIKSRITWGKPNGMPDSQGTARPSVAHEVIYMLAPADDQINCYRCKKTGSIEFFETRPEEKIPSSTRPDALVYRYVGLGTYYNAAAVRVPSASKSEKDGVKSSQKPVQSQKSKRGGWQDHKGLERLDALPKSEQQANGRLLRTYEPVPEDEFEPPMNDLWEIACAGYREAHFATFPISLASRCIQAGCPPEGTVLDIFGGAGTVGLAACLHNRKSILIELNEDYVAMARARIDQYFMGEKEKAYHKAAIDGQSNADLPLINLMHER